MSANTSDEISAAVANGEARIAELETRLAEAEDRLAEAEQTLEAIRSGEVDALVVSRPGGDRIFALEGADHSYRVLVEEMQEGTVTLDADGLILYSNRQFAALMRTPLETVVGSRIDRFLAPGWRALFSALLPDGGNQRKRGEITLTAADGTPVPVYASVNRLETGGLQTACVVITDLTEQRHQEAMIKEGELSQLILDQAAEAIVVIDARGKILRASESAKQLAGRDILQHHFDAAFRLSNPDFTVNTPYLLSTAVEGQGMRSVEVTLIRSDKRHSALLLSMEPLWSGEHDLLGCVVTLTDITQLKASEEAFARQAEALERTNNDLLQFAYAVSHDLREPARILAIYTQLLEKHYTGALDSRADEYMRHTVQAAHRLGELLDDLLVYTQTAESPRATDTLVDANIALSKALSIFETAFAESGGRAECDPLPMLRVDEVHLQQLFQNFIGNSLKYRSEEPPRVRVSAHWENSWWTLSVADNGIGIDPQYHRQIFGLFKRLHGGAKYTGSGIGLAICHKIVERYGGRVWVESEVGRGTTFFFTLPGENK